MKKSVLLGMAAIAAMGFTACNQTSTAQTAVTKASKDVLYSGIIPSADAEGTVLTLKLDYDDDHNYTDGDYLLVETTVGGDSVAPLGVNVVTTSYTEGDFRKESKMVDGVNVEYIRLVPDAKDALGAGSGASGYFIINADNSLTMTGSDLKAPENPVAYTLSVR